MHKVIEYIRHAPDGFFLYLAHAYSRNDTRHSYYNLKYVLGSLVARVDTAFLLRFQSGELRTVWPRILHHFQLRCQLLSTRRRSGIHTLGKLRERIWSIRSTGQGRVIACISSLLESISLLVDQSLRHLPVRYCSLGHIAYISALLQNMESFYGLVQEYSGEKK